MLIVVVLKHEKTGNNKMFMEEPHNEKRNSQ